MKQTKSQRKMECRRRAAAEGRLECDCGEKAFKLKWGTPVCKRCDEWETKWYASKGRNVR